MLGTTVTEETRKGSEKEQPRMACIRGVPWGSNQEVVNLTDRYVVKTYGRFPIAPVKGEGCRLWDADGKEYLDFVAGLAVCNLGHCHPRVVRAIQEQAASLLHVSNLYHIPWQSALARTIVEHSFGDRVFFCNSGAEANEAAIKLVRRYEKDIRKGRRSEILTMDNSFHGRTLVTVAATGQEKIKKGFDPLAPGFRHVPFDNQDALVGAIGDETCAILVEPIQGEGGIISPADDYLSFLRSVCDERELLLVFDEVQVGIGRTGTLFAYEQSGVAPDIMTLAKGLGGGMAIGAMVASERVAAAFTPGSHASTFGGNPLATAAGLATLETILEEGVLENCRRSGHHLREGLERKAARYPHLVREVRGRGLMQAMEVAVAGAPIVEKCMGQGLLINCTADTVLRFLPPLVVTTTEVDEMLEILDRVLSSTPSDGESAS
jgi:predicted acetylornithine/succinylornithine family transaminase